MDNSDRRTIEECVRSHASVMPEKTAVVCDGRTLSYARLWEEALRKRDELIGEGLAPGRLHIFRVSQDEDFIATYLAVHMAGAVAVPLERDCPETRFRDLVARYGDLVLPRNEDRMEEIADILFTTGSTGNQKGVMESYRAIWADTDNLIHAQGFSQDTVFVICGPLNHIGSLSKIWPVLTLGGTVFILEGMKNMGAFFRAFDYPSNKLATFMVPASIRMTLQLGKDEIGRIASKTDFIETGGAAIPQSDMDALCRLFPTTRLYNTYASTETGIVCTYDYNHNACLAGCTGKAMRNAGVFITPEGTIACKGDTLMSGYLMDDAATAAVLHDGTMFTNDLGEIDHEGRLHIRGRNSDVMNIGGYKVSPQEVEDAAMAFPDIADCVCFLTESPIFGKTIKLLYTAKDGVTIDKRSLARFVADRLEGYKVPRIFQQVASIRHTYNGKTDRKYYAVSGSGSE